MQFTPLIISYTTQQKAAELTWQDIAKILLVYEQEIEEGNISRYDGSDKVKPYCERVLEGFKKLKQL